MSIERYASFTPPEAQLQAAQADFRTDMLADNGVQSTLADISAAFPGFAVVEESIEPWLTPADDPKTAEGLQIVVAGQAGDQKRINIPIVSLDQDTKQSAETVAHYQAAKRKFVTAVHGIARPDEATGRFLLWPTYAHQAS